MAVKRPKAYWPLTVAAATMKIDVKVAGITYLATVVGATYYSANAFITAVQAALNASGSGLTYSFAYATTTGKVTWNATGSFQFLFLTGANAGSGAREAMGFTNLDTAAGASAVPPFQHSNGWYAVDPLLDDTQELSEQRVAQNIALSGKVKTITLTSQPLYIRVLQFGYLPEWKTFKRFEEINGNTNRYEALERLAILEGYGAFRWWEDQTDAGNGNNAALTAAEVLAGVQDHVMSRASIEKMVRNRASPGLAQYGLALTFLRKV